VRLIFSYANCTIVMKYLNKVPNSNNWYYIRRIPDDLHHHYETKKDKRIVKTTRTSDKKKAARIAMNLNATYEAEWERLRGNEAQINADSFEGAEKLLASFGLPPSPPPSSKENELETFFDSLESSLPEAAKQRIFDTRIHDGKELAEDIFRQYLSDEQKIAFDLSTGRFQWTASLICEEFLKLRNWVTDKKKSDAIRLAFREMIEALGDRRPSEYTKREVHQLIETMLSNGHRTATINRRLGNIRAAFNYVTDINDLKTERIHAFTKFDIPNKGLDKQDKEDFTPEQLNILRELVAERDDDISGLIALMLETGLRISEACSLRCTDIHTKDTPIPFVTLHRDPWRPLKTKNSQRFIPLIGVAEMTMKNSQGFWRFPQYISDERQRVKNDTASQAVNQRLKKWLGPEAPTAHSFRHTMNTRLRDAGCPKDVRDELGGWTKSLSDLYGSPTDIRLKADYIEASLAWKGQGWRGPR
jgi:integrase